MIVILVSAYAYIHINALNAKEISTEKILDFLTCLFPYLVKHPCLKVVGCLGNFYDKHHRFQLLKKKPEEDSLQVFNNYVNDIYL